MGVVLEFPGKKAESKVELQEVTPEILSQMVAWDEWASAVVILQRKNETVTLCSNREFRINNMMIDFAKLAIFMDKFHVSHKDDPDPAA